MASTDHGLPLNCPNILSLAIPNHAHPQNTLATHKVTAQCTAKTFAIQLEFSTWIFSHQSTITTPQSWDISHSAPPRGKVERYLLSQLSDICYKTANLNPYCRFMATKKTPCTCSEPLLENTLWTTWWKHWLNLPFLHISFHFSVAIGASRLCRETWKVKQHGRSHRLQAIFLREFCQGWRALVTCAEVTKEKAGWSKRYISPALLGNCTTCISGFCYCL